jgi:hypothetical protein
MAVITIAGVERVASIARGTAITISRGLNRRRQAMFSLDGDIAVAKLDPVEIYAADGTTLAFGGFIGRRSMAGVAPCAMAAIKKIECVDWLGYADYCYTSLSYDVPVAVENVIADLVSNHLGAFGLTYSPVTTGLVLQPFSWVRTRVSDAIRQITDKTGIVIACSPSKALSTIAFGAASAPIALTDAWPPTCIDFEWNDASTDAAPTRVILICGDASQKEVVTETFTADGVATAWTTAYPASSDIQDVWPNLVTLDGTVYPVGWGDQLGSSNFQWDWKTHTFSLASSPVAPTTGSSFSLTYTKQPPFAVVSDSGASPAIEYVEARPEITSIAEGQQAADSLRATKSVDPKAATATVLDAAGLEPAQQIAATIACRDNVDGTFVITNITEVISQADRVTQLELIESTLYRGDYLDEWRRLTGSTAGAVGGGGVAGGSGIGGSGSSTLSAFLGGARSTAVAPAASTWTPVPNFVDLVPAVAGSGLVRVALWSRESGVSVTARLHDVTADTAVTSSSVTSQTPVTVTFGVTLVAGHTYVLEVSSDTNGAGVYAIGTLQSF